jgi:hypothetical protein
VPLVSNRFEHVFWMGDMNYRLSDIDRAQADVLIAQGKA